VTLKSEKQLRALHDDNYVYRYHTDDKTRIRRLLKFMKFDKNDIVLDAGCGNGLSLDYIYNKVKFYYGVDFSEAFIKKAIDRRGNKKNAKFICSDIISFCHNYKGFFNKIFVLDVAEHIYDYKLMEIFLSLYDSLKSGGELYLHTPDGNYLLEIMKNSGLLKQLPEHIAIRTAAQYTELLQKSGFKDISIICLPHYIGYLAILDFLKYLPIVGKHFKARLFIICRK